jgi:hypothetical protein
MKKKKVGVAVDKSSLKVINPPGAAEASCGGTEQAQ